MIPQASKLKLFFAALLSTQAIASVAVAASDDLFISAVGDVMMGTDFPSASMLPKNNGVGLFEPAKQWLDASDIRFANLEGTLFDGAPQADGKRPGKNRYLFRTPTVMGQRLADAGFNMISLANNHVNDFGRAGAESTKSVLESLNISFSSKVGEVAEVSVKGLTVVMIATDFYRGNRSMVAAEAVFSEIRKLKSEGKIVLVSAHAGGEGTTRVSLNGTEMYLGENRGDSVKYARGAIDAGADSIIMHGPHVPRAIELYKKKLIIYSLGNFLTGPGISTGGVSGQAPLIRYQINAKGEFIGGQIVSFLQRKGPHSIAVDSNNGAYSTIYNMTQEQFQGGNLSFAKGGIIKPSSSVELSEP
jgi:hypothetical protein